jgi:hypothetical protein
VTAALLLALAARAAAQSPMPYSSEAKAAAPAVSTAAPAAAAAAAPESAVTLSTGGVKVAGELKPKLKRPIHATIHAEAKDWEPLSLKASGDPALAETRAVLRQAKVKGKYKGTASKAKAFARLRGRKDARELVISIFPKDLEKRRRHFEVRLRLIEGFVENVEASLVSVVDRRYTGAGMDSLELRERGVEFQEDSPSSGQILISALDPRPSKTAVNSGTLKLASFADDGVGLADVSWSVVGLK